MANNDSDFCGWFSENPEDDAWRWFSEYLEDDASTPPSSPLARTTSHLLPFTFPPASDLGESYMSKVEQLDDRKLKHFRKINSVAKKSIEDRRLLRAVGREVFNPMFFEEVQAVESHGERQPERRIPSKEEAWTEDGLITDK